MEEYRYCPNCGAEYDPDVEFCADCSERLVSFEEMQQLNIGKEEKAPKETVVSMTWDQDHAAVLADVLNSEGIAAKVEVLDTEAAGLTFSQGWLFHVVVPTEEEEKALFILQDKFEGIQQEQPPQEEVLEKVRRLEAAITADEAGLPALVEFFGDVYELSHRAMKAAIEFEEGVVLLVEWVKKVCREAGLKPEGLRTVGDACLLLGQISPTFALEELSIELINPDAWVRKNFCFALGKLAIERVIPFLVSELRDPDSGVRNEAIDQLYSLEDTCLGYDPDLEPEEQPEALARWQKLADDLK